MIKIIDSQDQGFLKSLSFTGPSSCYENGGFESDGTGDYRPDQ